MNLSDIDNKFEADFDDVDKWVDEHYTKSFSQYFDPVRKLISRMGDSFNPITDKELEEILSYIPLELFAVAEKLNDLKARIEVIKLRIKQEKRNNYINSEESSKADKQADAIYSVAEDEMLLRLYTSLIERVDSEISASKELIMSAKKIWTSRREAENIATAAEKTALPDYSDLDSQDQKQSYIK